MGIFKSIKNWIFPIEEKNEELTDKKEKEYFMSKKKKITNEYK